ncbi:MAG: 7-cyano-7-deazaguanine synthase QueC [Deltaproteobacteria bacterium]|nr:7-cyano-7-deazaguanine synthase QueC [Deltaproteobacteria bacterium]
MDTDEDRLAPRPVTRNQAPGAVGQPKAVVLLSGGMDSTVCAAMARADGFEVHALTARYGQRHGVEVDAARRVVQALGLASHTVVDLDLRAIGGSALTADIPVPKTAEAAPSPASPLAVPDARPMTPASPLATHSSQLAASSIPATYVPARNTILLGLALGHAEALGASDIYIGVSSVDYSGYPDCRPAFIETFERLARVATRAGVEGAPLRIHAPLQHLTKAETIRRGRDLGVDFSLTHTCYDPSPDGAACGACDACRLRREGFAAAGVPDPTRYAPAGNGTGSDGQARVDGQELPSLRVLEIYRTIQGETTFAGEPCVIVRLAGCPLRCSYCDTAYAREAEGMELSLDEVVRTVRELGPGIVGLTGGEPLAQACGAELARALADDGRTVLLETSGAFDTSAVDPRVRRILDVKTPGSGMEAKNLPQNLAALRPIDEAKFVLVDRADYDWARELVRRERLAEKCTVLFSPVKAKLPPADLAKWIIDDALPVRLQVQLHRVIWPERDRGV